MSNKNKSSASNSPAPAANFIRNIIEADLAANKFKDRTWAGQPGGANIQKTAALDTAKIRTRFPPEPNGYLHIGHAKSICVNFGLARDYGGVCHLRFDDTNPEKEEQEFVDSIMDAVHWLGFGWDKDAQQKPANHLFHASDYFDFMYNAAEALINAGLAYVDEQSADDMRLNRGTFDTPGTNSPFRSRTAAENIARFREMRDGKHADGSMILRAKIDMASPNINMRDPAIYRIRKATHHRTGDAWCIYPMYTYAHPIEDALEQITHSICTLEFEDQRPFYDWLLSNLAALGMLTLPAPKQYEFARLNLTYVITSKRKLAQLVNEKHVSGWDDPRMPTIVGLRRRGYTAAALQLLCDRTGVSKNNSWIDFSVLEGCLRDDLESKAGKAMAVIDPLKLIITNVDTHWVDTCSAPAHPQLPDLGNREFVFSRELWIEQDDFAEHPDPGYHRLFVGNSVRMKYGHVVKCTGFKKDDAGKVIEVHAELQPDSKSGTPGSNTYKVKGVITWVSAHDAIDTEVRLYDRLFSEAHPDAGGRDFLTVLNPNSKTTVRAKLEPSLAKAAPGQIFQFERLGYFVADQVDSKPGVPVFNRAVTLKDGWSK